MLRVHFLREKLLALHLGLVLQALPSAVCNGLSPVFSLPVLLPPPPSLTFSQVRSISTNVRRNLAFHTLSQEVLLKEFSTIS